MKETKSLRDEIKEERSRLLEGKSTGYKIKYYVYYYKWYALGLVAALILIGSVIHSIRTNKDSALGVALINAAYDVDFDVVSAEFESYAEIDDKHRAELDSSFTLSYDGEGAYDMQSEEKLFLTVATGQIDVVIAPESIFKRFADIGYISDLGDFLSEEDLSKYDDIFIGHVADDSVEAVDDPDAPRHEVRSGINITDFARVKREGWYKDAPEPIYLGFVAEGGNAENAVRFFEFINE